MREKKCNFSYLLHKNILRHKKKEVKREEEKREKNYTKGTGERNVAGEYLQSIRFNSIIPLDCYIYEIRLVLVVRELNACRMLR